MSPNDADGTLIGEPRVLYCVTIAMGNCLRKTETGPEQYLGNRTFLISLVFASFQVVAMFFLIPKIARKNATEK